MAKEMAKAYNPKEVEDKIYDFWQEGNYFHAEVDKDKKPYTIRSGLIRSIFMQKLTEVRNHLLLLCHLQILQVSYIWVMP